MKFEPPIAEIELFDLRDIISASNEDAGEDLPIENTRDTSSIDFWVDNCVPNLLDNDDWENCL